MIHVGDIIVKDYSIITLETEKASMDVPAPLVGKLLKFCRKGQKVSRWDLIAKVIKTVVVKIKFQLNFAASSTLQLLKK